MDGNKVVLFLINPFNTNARIAVLPVQIQTRDPKNKKQECTSTKAWGFRNKYPNLPGKKAKHHESELKLKHYTPYRSSYGRWP
jgi:hypothetical protein